MVFKDTDPTSELNNRLRTFRAVFGGDNSIIIANAGNVNQTLIQYTFMINESPNYDYSKTLTEFVISECKFIPKYMIEFISTVEKYRNNLDHIESDEELNEIMPLFLNSFNEVLKGFYDYFNKSNSIKQPTELKKTIIFLNDKMESLKQGENWNIINNQESYLSMFEIVIEKLNYLIKSIDILNKNLEQISDSLHKFNEDYKQDQKLIAEKINNAHNFEKIEKHMDKFTTKTVKRIVRDNDEIFRDYDYEDEEKELINFLGEKNWEKLTPNSQKFLVTSRLTFRSLNKFDDLVDYSPVCLLVSKALELELKRRFFKKFKKYIIDKHGNNYSEYPPSLGKKRGEKFYYKKCTLGSFPFILGYKKDPKENYVKNISSVIEYSKEMLFKNFSDDDEEIKNTLRQYGEYIENINSQYRNPSAHSNYLDITHAEDCFDYVIKVQKVLKIMLDSFDY